MRTLDRMDFEDKKALVRVDFNVPLNAQHQIEDDTRLEAALPTINRIINDAGSAILMSHLGRPKGKEDSDLSLKHLLPYLKEHLDAEVKFAPDCIGEEAEKAAGSLLNGEVLLLENLRFHKEEKEGDPDFARKLASLADVYVNDAFGTAHRAHASTSVVANYFDEKAFGFVMQREQEMADRILHRAESPFTLIMGGAKVSDKIPVIDRMLDKVNTLIIGGAMAYTFFKAIGGEVGDSRVEGEMLDTARDLLEKAKIKNVSVLLPIDSVTATDISDTGNTEVHKSDNIPGKRKGLDIGPDARKQFAEAIMESKTILWNGPMGVFEKDAIAEGTKAVADAVVKCTKERNAFSMVGGGETTSALQKTGNKDGVSFVSTGGGALLEYMEGKELPGIIAIGSEE